MRKKLLAAVGALVLLLGAAYGVLSLRWHPARHSGPPRLEALARGRGPLLAGASVVPLDLPAAVPVAGSIPRLRWLAEGRRDPISARALVLQEPGCTVALVSLEILLVPGDLERAIEKRLRDLKLDGLVVAATHTHAGPGGFWNEPLVERVATGPYSEAVFEDLVQRSERAVRDAHAALEPAYLSVGRGVVTSLVHSRRGGEVDGRLVSARFTGLSGRAVGDIALYPSHGTLLGLDYRRVSGDWPGALMRSRKAPLLFFQGAVGDQTPTSQPEPGEQPEAYARALAERLDHLDRGLPDPWPELAAATVSEVMPPSDFGASPAFLRRVTRNLLYDLMPDRAQVVAIRLGALTLLAVPVEPVAEVGRRWRSAAGEGAEILSLAGDYLGYVETSERMAEMAGETVHTYYGPELAERLGGAVKVAAEAVRAGPAPGVAAAR